MNKLYCRFTFVNECYIQVYFANNYIKLIFKFRLCQNVNSVYYQKTRFVSQDFSIGTENPEPQRRYWQSVIW